MKLKVFQGMKFGPKGQVKACIATTSQAKAAAAAGLNLAYVRDYWTVTGNPTQIAAAMSQPGVLFVSSSSQSDDYRPEK